MLTVKKSNHKTRSRDLLLTLMFYAWEQQIHVVIGRENYYRDRKCRKCLHNLSDRRFDSCTMGTFRSEDEDDYEYEFSVLSTRTSKNVGLQTLCACSVRKTRTRSRPRPPPRPPI